MPLGQRIRFAFRAFFSLLFHGMLAAEIADAARRATPASAASAMPADVPASRRQREAFEGALPGARPGEPAGTALDVESAADGAVQMLSLLQRDARLIDFLMEDVSDYPDAQVGAAVRDVHANARRTLAHYLELEPVLDGSEDQPVTLPQVDPSAVKLVGRTTVAAPVRGVLRHRGWRTGRVSLPPLPRAAARQIVAPAEVEIP
jgi:hypothetical protein